MYLVSSMNINNLTAVYNFTQYKESSPSIFLSIAFSKKPHILYFTIGDFDLHLYSDNIIL